MKRCWPVGSIRRALFLSWSHENSLLMTWWLLYTQSMRKRILNMVTKRLQWAKTGMSTCIHFDTVHFIPAPDQSHPHSPLVLLHRDSVGQVLERDCYAFSALSAGLSSHRHAQVISGKDRTMGFVKPELWASTYDLLVLCREWEWGNGGMRLSWFLWIIPSSPTKHQ